jgi:hypothetical protein
MKMQEIKTDESITPILQHSIASRLDLGCKTRFT